MRYISVDIPHYVIVLFICSVTIIQKIIAPSKPIPLDIFQLFGGS
nr:MAG TPA: hypothetical protein [Caudoviricetes sp.]